MSVEDLRRLFVLVMGEGADTRRWEASDEIRVGGDHRGLSINANGRAWKVPDELVDRDDRRARHRIVQAMDALVPDSVWAVELARQDRPVASIIMARRAAGRSDP